MKTIILVPAVKQFANTIVLSLVILFTCLLSLPGKAQDSMHLYSVTYIKLKDPSYAKKYEGMLSYYGKQTATYGVKSGKIQGYSVWKVIMPSGSTNDYDYEVVIGSNNLQTLLDDTASAMKNAIPGMTDEMLKTVNEEFGNIRTIVKREIYAGLDFIDMPTEPKYVEVDFMKPAAGKFADYVKSERETWKPVHQQRIKLGGLSGWSISEKMLPAGDKEGYDVITTNGYDSLPMMLNTKYIQAFKTVWPKMDINKVATDAGNMRTMVKSDILKYVFAVSADTMKQ